MTPMVAAVVNANTALFISDRLLFSLNFNQQLGNSFPGPSFAKGLPHNLILMNG
jgi:hypothetical protein